MSKKVDFPPNNNKIIFEWQNIEAQLSWAKKYQKNMLFSKNESSLQIASRERGRNVQFVFQKHRSSCGKRFRNFYAWSGVYYENMSKQNHFFSKNAFFKKSVKCTKPYLEEPWELLRTFANRVIVNRKLKNITKSIYQCIATFNNFCFTIIVFPSENDR